ncbi:MAG: hypothetical protein M0R33_15580 [Methylomonas sp.]|jgi:hypothetical protein|uniref:hypothetical protein n=1 Tax=Methylomonas sp. TaxID=418 RepID=UPI0025E253EC|nr:hypothetical protein [Methylomonas sp.]MCK9607864.1 hypothetical protein [Methylomonas sp.]
MEYTPNYEERDIHQTVSDEPKMRDGAYVGSLPSYRLTDKFEFTSIPDAYEFSDYARRTVADRRPDAPLFEDEAPRTRAGVTRGLIDIYATGFRNGGDAPAHPEVNLYEVDRDERTTTGDPNMFMMAQQSKIRSQYARLDFQDETTPQTSEAHRGECREIADRVEAGKRAHKTLVVFSPAKINQQRSYRPAGVKEALELKHSLRDVCRFGGLPDAPSQGMRADGLPGKIHSALTGVDGEIMISDVAEEQISPASAKDSLNKMIAAYAIANESEFGGQITTQSRKHAIARIMHCTALGIPPVSDQPAAEIDPDAQLFHKKSIPLPRDITSTARLAATDAQFAQQQFLSRQVKSSAPPEDVTAVQQQGERDGLVANYYDEARLMYSQCHDPSIADASTIAQQTARDTPLASPFESRELPKTALPSRNPTELAIAQELDAIAQSDYQIFSYSGAKCPRFTPASQQPVDFDKDAFGDDSTYSARTTSKQKPRHGFESHLAKGGCSTEVEFLDFDTKKERHIAPLGSKYTPRHTLRETQETAIFASDA